MQVDVNRLYHSFILKICFKKYGSSTFYGGLVGLILIAGLYASCFLFALKNRSIFSIVLTAFGLAAVQTDGMGLLSKPKEEWFNVCLPIAIVIGLSLLMANTKKDTGHH